MILPLTTIRARYPYWRTRGNIYRHSNFATYILTAAAATEIAPRNKSGAHGPEGCITNRKIRFVNALNVHATWHARYSNFRWTGGRRDPWVDPPASVIYNILKL